MFCRLAIVLATLCVPVDSVAQSFERLAAVPPQFFGLVVHRLTSSTPWPPVPVGALRLWDTKVRWTDLEPAPGVWRFDELDRQVAIARNHSVELLYTLGQTPRWASSRPAENYVYGPGAGAMPSDPASFARYAQVVTERYGGDIAAFQVWNEPKFFDARGTCGGIVFFCGDIAQLVELTRQARAGLKASGSRALLVGPSFTGGLPALRHIEQYLDAGAGAFLDAFSVHLYLAQPEDGWIMLARVRDVLNRRGLARLPIWNTEVGYLIQNDESSVKPEHPVGPASRVFSPHEGAGLLARVMMVSASAGVERVHWYAWDNGRMGAWSARTGKPNEVGIAFGVVQRWLIGSQLRCGGSAPEWSCTLRRSGRTATIAWRSDGRPVASLSSAAFVERLDGSAGGVAPGETVEKQGRPFLRTADGRPW